MCVQVFESLLLISNKQNKVNIVEKNPKLSQISTMCFYIMITLREVVNLLWLAE